MEKKTVDIFHGDRAEEKFEQGGKIVVSNIRWEKKKKKKTEGPAFSIIKTSLRAVFCLFNCKKKKKKKKKEKKGNI